MCMDGAEKGQEARARERRETVRARELGRERNTPGRRRRQRRTPGTWRWKRQTICVCAAGAQRMATHRSGLFVAARVQISTWVRAEHLSLKPAQSRIGLREIVALQSLDDVSHDLFRWVLGGRLNVSLVGVLHVSSQHTLPRSRRLSVGACARSRRCTRA